MEDNRKDVQLTSRSPQLLLVEDNIADAKLFMKLFAGPDFGGTLNWVTDGEQALEYLFRRGEFSNVQPTQLVFLDMNLPKIGGKEVLMRLRRNEETSRIPVIVITTSDREEDVKLCQELGVRAFFTKPGELGELRNLIERLKTIEIPRLGVVVNAP